MKKYLNRFLSAKVENLLSEFPVVAILGPRQCGKTTLVKHLLSNTSKYLCLDLEKPSDLKKLTDPELFFETNSDKLFCLDEIQRLPDIFPIIRSFCDEQDRNELFLILGSASPELLRQSSESLAGRIIYTELSPFLFSEVVEKYCYNDLVKFWNRGGFPRSFLAKNDATSYIWRQNFIKTFLERDIPALNFNITSQTMQRLLTMLAHSHGQIANYSKLGASLGVSNHTVKSYIDLLSQTFIVRVLQAYKSNTKKRLIKSPKVYIRDSGILHALLDLQEFAELFSHPIFGASWEGMAIESIIIRYPQWKPSFYRSSNGAELDLILQKGIRKIAFEFKASKSPTLTKGFWNSFEEIKPDKTYIVAPIEDTYPIKENIFVCGLNHIECLEKEMES